VHDAAGAEREDAGNDQSPGKNPDHGRAVLSNAMAARVNDTDREA
jgi:hypothetical protein